MRFLRKIAGILGFAKEEDDHDFKDQHNEHEVHSPNRTNFAQSGLPRKGFGVPVQVAVDRPQLGPIIIPCSTGDGGVQGLKWHTKRLRIDEDGDVAEEFLDEVLPEAAENQSRPMPRFVEKYNTTPAKVKNQIISADGRIQLCVEYQGRLLCV